MGDGESRDRESASFTDSDSVSPPPKPQPPPASELAAECTESLPPPPPPPPNTNPAPARVGGSFLGLLAAVPPVDATYSRMRQQITRITNCELQGKMTDTTDKIICEAVRAFCKRTKLLFF